MSGRRRHPSPPEVDQSDRTAPRNLRQTGDADVDLVISTRVRKSPFWHLSAGEGCHEAMVYNHARHRRTCVGSGDGRGARIPHLGGVDAGLGTDVGFGSVPAAKVPFTESVNLVARDRAGIHDGGNTGE